MIRILHVVGSMNRGGAETWLMHVLRNVDREKFRMDFLVHTAKPGAYDEEIRTMGSKIIPCLSPRRPWAYARTFRQAVREHGPYEVVHSHVHHYSGYVLRLAQQLGVRARFAHSHSDTGSVQASAGALRQIYLAVTNRWIRQYATAGLACSTPAGVSLFGPSWQTDRRWRTLYCGIDLAAFRTVPDRAVVRAELGMPRDALIIGHVGRFVEQKNHSFLLKVAAEVVRREPTARFLLVGDGHLRPAIEAEVSCLGLTRHFLFTGVRSDIPRLLLGAMDLFLFPSRHEGLPLALLEAQAAGLPCVYSAGLSGEAAVVKHLLHPVSLSAPLETWVERLLSATRKPRKEGGCELLSASAFDIRTSVRELTALYEHYAI